MNKDDWDVLPEHECRIPVGKKPPKIAIGAPIRNRRWILPEYLEALLKIRYPPGLQYMFLENGSNDDTFLYFSYFC